MSTRVPQRSLRCRASCACTAPTNLFERPRIVTDDRRDKPGKTSLATAAGMLDIATVPLKAFLDLEGARIART